MSDEQDLQTLDSAARQVAGSPLLPYYAKAAIAALDRLVTNQARALGYLQSEVRRLREEMDTIKSAGDSINKAMSGDQSGPVLVERSNPGRLTFIRIPPGAAPGVEV